jgi:hypothetical protein
MYPEWLAKVPDAKAEIEHERQCPDRAQQERSRLFAPDADAGPHIEAPTVIRTPAVTT